MSPTAISLLAYVSILLALISVTSLLSDFFLPDRSRVNRRLEELQKGQKEKVRKSSLFKDLHKLKPSEFGSDSEPRLTIRQRLERLLEQSGLDWTLYKLLAISTASSLGFTLPGAAIQRSIAFAVIGALVGVWLPLLYVKMKRKARLKALCDQLPEAYDLMARGLRAGQTVSMTMQGVAEEFPQPIAGEFAYCYEQQNLGLPADVALRDLSRRTALMEINIFVVAVVIQKQVGGNLAEMLEKLALIVRQRAKMRGTISTLTAEGRMQAVMLMALPPGIFGIMLVLNREYAIVLFQYPLLLVGVLVSMTMGALWIRKIINFDF
jgi:tight adherence protein B